jgi:acylphosphatase
MKKRLIIHVIGKVQGVWFRRSTKEKANELNISGFCKNLENGSVYIEAEGDLEALKYFSDWCKIGPELADVSEIKITEEALEGYSSFEIRS